MDSIKKQVGFILRKLGLLSIYSLKQVGPLKEDGWFISFRKESCIDAEGNPLPWLTYPAIEFIKKRINNDMCVFEYGCGESTLWWADRVKEVYSVEHDVDWYNKIFLRIPGNVHLRQIDLEYGGAYSTNIGEYSGKFEVIIIDGRDRVNCALNALDALKPDGVIIFDNSDRKEYEKGYEHLLKSGFRKIEFVGFAPIVCMKTETSIFYRKNNCFGI